jgi:hypothetical protein
MDKPSYPEKLVGKILSYFTTVFHLNKFSAECAIFDRDVANCLLGSDKHTKDWVWKIRVAKRSWLLTVLFVKMFRKFYLFLLRIDLFSLDIEGAEYNVLKTVPWDKVNIDALLVEVICPPIRPKSVPLEV